MFYIEYNEPWYLQELVPFIIIGALGVSIAVSAVGKDGYIILWLYALYVLFNDISVISG